MYLPIIILFIFGLISGSFLNVVASRYREDKFLFNKKNLGGRSRCPQCRKQLNWYELIPLVSFFAQVGKCRGCRQPISWQYPLVELLSGLIFLIPIYFYSYFHISEHLLADHILVWYYWLSVIWVLAGWLMLLLSVIDYRLYFIPDEAVIGIALLGVLAAGLKFYYQDLINWQSSFVGNYAMLVALPVNLFWSHVAAGIIGLLFFGVIFFITKGKGMGFGDVKLAGALGLLLGWPDSILSFALSFMIGSVGGLLLMFLGRKKFRQPIPFGPYLIVGVFVTVFFGFQIVDGYFKLFGLL